MQQRAVLSDNLISILKRFLIEVAGDLRLTQHHSPLHGQYLNALLFLLISLVKQPLTRFHNVIVVQSVGPLTFIFSEIAAETLEDLLDCLLVDGFRAIIVEFAVDVELD
jgi:hypothetical protein